MNITHEDRVEFLKSFNDLRNALQTMHECQDIWLSDIGKLEHLEYLLKKTLKFTPQVDENGNATWHEDYILDRVGEDNGSSS